MDIIYIMTYLCVQLSLVPVQHECYYNLDIRHYSLVYGRGAQLQLQQRHYRRLYSSAWLGTGPVVPYHTNTIPWYKVSNPVFTDFFFQEKRVFNGFAIHSTAQHLPPSPRSITKPQYPNTSHTVETITKPRYPNTLLDWWQ